MDMKEIALQITLKAMDQSFVYRVDSRSCTNEEGVKQNAKLVNAFYTSVYDNLVMLNKKEL